MFKKISLTTLFVITAISAIGCAPLGLQLPASFPQLPDVTLPSIAPAASSSNAPNESTQNAPTIPPGSEPQAGLNGQGGKPGKGAAALLQLLNRLGWEGGVITKVSSDQITLRTIERPALSGNPGQNQPGQNGQTQPGQKRQDPARVETVNVNSGTIIIVPGKTSATLSDVHVGDRLIADVPNGQKFAVLVLSAPKEIDKDNVTLGMVTSNSNGSITLRTPGSGDTVSTTSATQVFKLTRDTVTPGSVSEVQNGNLIFAMGTGNNDAFSAQVIFALPQGALGLGKGLGGNNNNRRNPQPQQQPAPKSGG